MIMFKAKNAYLCYTKGPVFPQLDTFERAYINAALWASNDESDESGGRPLDVNFSIIDLPIETVQKLKSDCAEFLKIEGVQPLLDEAYDLYRFGDEQAGADLWLTRNGHGAGFFDRNLETIGEKLTEICRGLPTRDLYIGDDGNVYVS
jgi:hypothetical protein